MSVSYVHFLYGTDILPVTQPSVAKHSKQHKALTLTSCLELSFLQKAALLSTCQLFDTSKKVKLKASHTRYRALDPELILVYTQSTRR